MLKNESGIFLEVNQNHFPYWKFAISCQPRNADWEAGKFSTVAKNRPKGCLKRKTKYH